MEQENVVEIHITNGYSLHRLYAIAFDESARSLGRTLDRRLDKALDRTPNSIHTENVLKR